MNACTCAVRPLAWVATFWLVQTSLFSRQTYRLIIQDFAGHHELMSADLGTAKVWRLSRERSGLKQIKSQLIDTLVRDQALYFLGLAFRLWYVTSDHILISFLLLPLNEDPTLQPDKHGLLRVQSISPIRPSVALSFALGFPCIMGSHIFLKLKEIALKKNWAVFLRVMSSICFHEDMTSVRSPPNYVVRIEMELRQEQCERCTLIIV